MNKTKRLLDDDCNEKTTTEQEHQTNPLLLPT